MRRTQTSGSSYYDGSLLENPGDVPLRNIAPNEYSHVNPLLPNGEETPLTLGDHLGSNPGDRNVGSPSSGTSGRYNPETEGVYNSWSGGADRPFEPAPNPNNNYDTRSDRDPIEEAKPEDGDPRGPWDALLRRTNTSSGESDANRCDGIGPGKCDPPPGIEIIDNRLEEEIEAQLWTPPDMSRSGFYSAPILSLLIE